MADIVLQPDRLERHLRESALPGLLAHADLVRWPSGPLHSTCRRGSADQVWTVLFPQRDGRTRTMCGPGAFRAVSDLVQEKNTDWGFYRVEHSSGCRL